MKKSLQLLSLLFFISYQSQSLKVMSYNIRLSLESDKENSWENRKSETLQLMDYYHPDVFGVQEAVPKQIIDIEINLKQYDFIGVGRDDGKNKGEYSAIFYDTEKIKVLESGTFWLSETPEIPSKGWDAAYNRVCSYGLFKMKKSGKKFWVFNVHFDHVGNIAREKSAQLILEKIKTFNSKNLPVILMGDFNLTDDKQSIKNISKTLNNTYYHSLKKPYGPKGTFTAFDTTKIPTERIDYIFVKDFVTKNFRTINDRRENLLYPSDHFPIIVDLRF